MSIPSESAADDEEEHSETELRPPAHHPSAPADELFDISTTVDPSYVISLIRKLLPSAVDASIDSDGIDPCGSPNQGPKDVGVEQSLSFQPVREVVKSLTNENEGMDAVNEFGDADGQEGRDDSSGHQEKRLSIGEDSWEEHGCILWDLAASKTHAELMVQNLVLEVLLATLTVSQSPRVTEISLGIIGNLACHEVSRKHIVSTKGLVGIIVDQLFLDDTACLCEACRLLTLCLQGSEAIMWAGALQPEHVLSRVLWITENTLNPQLMERIVGLLLAVLESRQGVATVLLPCLVKLGLPHILINLLAFEMSKLVEERLPERYSVLDLILRTIEALSVIDGYSQELCCNKKLLHLLNNLIKLPDRIEVSNSCVTAAVLLANILADADDLVLEIIHDLSFFQGLLDLFPFASDDVEARSAIWSTIARLLVQVQENEMSRSSLHQYVSVLVSKLDLIEEELLDHQLDVSNVDCEISSSSSGVKLNARTAALTSIYDILNQWMTLEDHIKGSNLEENYVNEGAVDRLKNCCKKYCQFNAGSCGMD